MSNNIVDRLNIGKNERIIPEQSKKGIVSIHLKRYQFASQYCKDKIVLDAACGVGYGAFYLADIAKNVIGLDIDQDAVNYANKHYKKSNVSFFKMDISKEIRFPDKYFDVVCSFETIEHLSDINVYLGEVVRVLNDNGIYFLSTPYIKKTKFCTKNIYHHIEYAIDDLEKILKSYFNRIEFYGQRRKSNSMHKLLRRLDVFNIRRLNLDFFKRLNRITGNVPFGELSLNDIEIARDNFHDATTLIVACKEKKS